MPRLRKIKLDNTTYDIAPSKLSDGTFEMSMPTLTQNAVIQEQLVSGTSIKTINNISLLGSGNIDVGGGGSGTTVIANPTLVGTEDNLVGLQVGETKYKVDENVIEGITYNGATVPVTNKIAAITGETPRIPLITIQPSSSAVLDPYKMYDFGTVAQAINITFNSSLEPAGYCAEYMLRVTAGANCAITLPNTVEYNGGQAPVFVTGHIYEFNISDNLCVVGEFY